jgi:hypothetical protein
VEYLSADRLVKFSEVESGNSGINHCKTHFRDLSKVCGFNAGHWTREIQGQQAAVERAGCAGDAGVL